MPRRKKALAKRMGVKRRSMKSRVPGIRRALKSARRRR